MTAQVIDLPTREALNDDERRRLDRLEVTIERGITAWQELGQALKEVRDSRLYRETHGTFEAYCRERWGLSRSRAYQLIDASDLVGEMSTTVDTPLPATESQARELAGLPAEQAAEVMREAHAKTDGKPTAKTIREIRQGIGDPDEIQEANWRSNFRSLKSVMDMYVQTVKHGSRRDQLLHYLRSLINQLEKES